MFLKRLNTFYIFSTYVLCLLWWHHFFVQQTQAAPFPDFGQGISSAKDFFSGFHMPSWSHGQKTDTLALDGGLNDSEEEFYEDEEEEDEEEDEEVAKADNKLETIQEEPEEIGENDQKHGGDDDDDASFGLNGLMKEDEEDDASFGLNGLMKEDEKVEEDDASFGLNGLMKEDEKDDASFGLNGLMKEDEKVEEDDASFGLNGLMKEDEEDDASFGLNGLMKEDEKVEEDEEDDESFGLNGLMKEDEEDDASFGINRLMKVDEDDHPAETDNIDIEMKDDDEMQPESQAELIEQNDEEEDNLSYGINKLMQEDDEHHEYEYEDEEEQEEEVEVVEETAKDEDVEIVADEEDNNDEEHESLGLAEDTEGPEDTIGESNQKNLVEENNPNCNNEEYEYYEEESIEIQPTPKPEDDDESDISIAGLFDIPEDEDDDDDRSAKKAKPVPVKVQDIPVEGDEEEADEEPELHEDNEEEEPEHHEDDEEEETHHEEDDEEEQHEDEQEVEIESKQQGDDEEHDHSEQIDEGNDDEEEEEENKEPSEENTSTGGLIDERGMKEQNENDDNDESDEDVMTAGLFDEKSEEENTAKEEGDGNEVPGNNPACEADDASYYEYVTVEDYEEDDDKPESPVPDPGINMPLPNLNPLKSLGDNLADEAKHANDWIEPKNPFAGWGNLFGPSDNNNSKSDNDHAKKKDKDDDHIDKQVPSVNQNIQDPDESSCEDDELESYWVTLEEDEDDPAIIAAAKQMQNGGFDPSSMVTGAFKDAGSFVSNFVPFVPKSPSPHENKVSDESEILEPYSAYEFSTESINQLSSIQSLSNIKLNNGDSNETKPCSSQNCNYADESSHLLSLFYIIKKVFSEISMTKSNPEKLVSGITDKTLSPSSTFNKLNHNAENFLPNEFSIDNTPISLLLPHNDNQKNTANNDLHHFSNEYLSSNQIDGVEKSPTQTNYDGIKNQNNMLMNLYDEGELHTRDNNIPVVTPPKKLPIPFVPKISKPEGINSGDQNFPLNKLTNDLASILSDGIPIKNPDSEQNAEHLEESTSKLPQKLSIATSSKELNDKGKKSEPIFRNSSTKKLPLPTLNTSETNNLPKKLPLPTLNEDQISKGDHIKGNQPNGSNHKSAELDSDNNKFNAEEGKKGSFKLPFQLVPPRDPNPKDIISSSANQNSVPDQGNSNFNEKSELQVGPGNKLPIPTIPSTVNSPDNKKPDINKLDEPIISVTPKPKQPMQTISSTVNSPDNKKLDINKSDEPIISTTKPKQKSNSKKDSDNKPAQATPKENIDTNERTNPKEKNNLSTKSPPSEKSIDNTKNETLPPKSSGDKQNSKTKKKSPTLNVSLHKLLDPKTRDNIFQLTDHEGKKIPIPDPKTQKVHYTIIPVKVVLPHGFLPLKPPSKKVKSNPKDKGEPTTDSVDNEKSKDNAIEKPNIENSTSSKKPNTKPINKANSSEKDKNKFPDNLPDKGKQDSKIKPTLGNADNQGSKMDKDKGQNNSVKPLPKKQADKIDEAKPKKPVNKIEEPEVKKPIDGIPKKTKRNEKSEIMKPEDQIEKPAIKKPAEKDQSPPIKKPDKKIEKSDEIKKPEIDKAEKTKRKEPVTNEIPPKKSEKKQKTDDKDKHSNVPPSTSSKIDKKPVITLEKPKPKTDVDNGKQKPKLPAVGEKDKGQSGKKPEEKKVPDSQTNNPPTVKLPTKIPPPKLSSSDKVKSDDSKDKSKIDSKKPEENKIPKKTVPEKSQSPKLTTEDKIKPDSKDKNHVDSKPVSKNDSDSKDKSNLDPKKPVNEKIPRKTSGKIEPPKLNVVDKIKPNGNDKSSLDNNQASKKDPKPNDKGKLNNKPAPKKDTDPKDQIKLDKNSAPKKGAESKTPPNSALPSKVPADLEKRNPSKIPNANDTNPKPPIPSTTGPKNPVNSDKLPIASPPEKEKNNKLPIPIPSDKLPIASPPEKEKSNKLPIPIPPKEDQHHLPPNKPDKSPNDKDQIALPTKPSKIDDSHTKLPLPQTTKPNEKEKIPPADHPKNEPKPLSNISDQSPSSSPNGNVQNVQFPPKLKPTTEVLPPEKPSKPAEEPIPKKQKKADSTSDVSMPTNWFDDSADKSEKNNKKKGGARSEPTPRREEPQNKRPTSLWSESVEEVPAKKLPSRPSFTKPVDEKPTPMVKKKQKEVPIKSESELTVESESESAPDTTVPTRKGGWKFVPLGVVVANWLNGRPLADTGSGSRTYRRNKSSKSFKKTQSKRNIDISEDMSL